MATNWLLPVPTGFRLIPGQIINAILEVLNGTVAGVFKGVFNGTVGATTPAAASVTTLTVGAGTSVTKIVKYAPSLSPVSVAANTSAEQTFTVAGLTTADTVFVNKPTAQAGLGIVGVRVSAANTLAITFGNFTASPIVPTAAQAYAVVAIRT